MKVPKVWRNCNRWLWIHQSDPVFTFWPFILFRAEDETRKEGFFPRLHAKNRQERKKNFSCFLPSFFSHSPPREKEKAAIFLPFPANFSRALLDRLVIKLFLRVSLMHFEDDHQCLCRLFLSSMWTVSMIWKNLVQFCSKYGVFYVGHFFAFSAPQDSIHFSKFLLSLWLHKVTSSLQ